MANLIVGDLISTLKADLNQFTMSGERVQSNEASADLASSNFSEADLAERLFNAWLDAAFRMAAHHLKGLWVTFNPTDKLDDWPNTMAIRGDATALSGVQATRRSILEHMQKNRDLDPLTDATPVYVFEDMEFIIAGTAEGSSRLDSNLADATTGAIREPRAMRQGSPDSEVAEFPDDDDFDDVYLEGASERFESIILNHAKADCFMTLAGAGGPAAELWAALAKTSYDDFLRGVAPYRQQRFVVQGENMQMVL